MTEVRTSYGYDTYRGRSKLRTVLTALIVLLVLVLVAAVAAFFLLQDYVYYSDDGKAHIDLPFLQGDEPPAPSVPVPDSSGDVVVVTPSPTPSPTPAPAAALVELPRSALTDGSAVQAVADAGGNGAVFDMKADDGTLGYVSDLPQAIAYGASAAQPGRNDAIRALNAAEGLYTVARVSCFRDNLAPKMQNSLALRSSAGNWRDGQGVRWLSPAVDGSGEYLAGICRELAALGFDELWLDHAAFPSAEDGKLENLLRGERYDPEDLAGPVEGFYRRVSEVLADYPGVKLSVSVGGELLTRGEAGSGQSLALLETYAYRVYVPGPESEAVSRQYDAALAGLDRAPELVFTTEPYTPVSASSYAPAGGRLVRPAGE